ncbi:flagellin [Methyloglobulus morosus KoM1]|uniref:Flagellin n=1 Tax=Methyloglobulus morosus KoM1 TaxID=1116472 RepID=V5C4H2_9GAMM|nr:flagellin [Methyloglobulus morosus]ESS73382.1 flagellin [Methyloglobulus morosus KoM1]
MAQVINTNVGALFAGAALNKSANALQTAQARLSSGLRINSAKDDATGLVTATGYDSQIRGTNMAIRNANDGISKAQTNDGYASQITENLQRLRELAVQAGGTAAGTEATALVTENARLAGKTAAATAVTVDGNGTTFTGVSTAVTATVGLTVAAIDTDIAAVAANRAQYGADMSTLGSAVSGMQTASVNLSASFSRIMDTDFAAESANMTRNNILQQAGTAVLSQANQTPNSVLGLLR